MNYLLVVQAPCARVSKGTFATESAFGEHLRILRGKLGPRFDRMIIAAPRMTDADYATLAPQLAHIDEAKEGIEYLPLHSMDTRARRFWVRDARTVWRSLRDAARSSAVVHSGMSDDLFRPVMAMANIAGALEGKSVVFIVDIDFRRDTYRYRKTGLSSLRHYLVSRFVYDPIKVAQVALAPKYCSLVLLKSAKMVEDFGRGADHVRNFFNAAHSAQHVISEAELDEKLARLERADRPLKLVYFGRLIAYKGVDRTIRAVQEARSRSGRAIELHLIGGGPQKTSLERLVSELGAGDAVHFHPPVPFGTKLFELVRSFDVSVATPLVEDTPRSAFDALASGVPILAFDIQYYRDIAEASEAVTTTPWEDVGALATKILELDRDRSRLVAQARRGVTFARENTADIWLDRRVEWTLAMLDESGMGQSGAPPESGGVPTSTFPFRAAK